MAKEKAGRMRARLKDGLVTVKVLLNHPMETGSRPHPATGKLLPRRFIRDLVCEHNGEPVMTLEWGWGVAANPYVSFDLKGGETGDLVAVRWVDNEGVSGRLETEVK